MRKGNEMSTNREVIRGEVSGGRWEWGEGRTIGVKKEMGVSVRIHSVQIVQCDLGRNGKPMGGFSSGVQSEVRKNAAPSIG